MARSTLEEAINRARKIADRHRWNAENTGLPTSNEETNELYRKTCIKYAEIKEQYAEWFEELKAYKDAEEQGLLVRLPCKEAYSQSGDYVYLIDDYEIVKCVHCGLGINPLNGKAYITLMTDERIFPYRSPDPEQDLEPADWCTNKTDVEVGEIGKKAVLDS